MQTPRPWYRLRLMIAVATLGQVPTARSQDVPPAPGEPVKATPLKRGEVVGRITKVDVEKGVIRIDIGKGRGAVVGLRLIVLRENPDAKAEESDRWHLIGRVEIIDVDAADSGAKLLNEPVFDDRGLPRDPELHVGDKVESVTDPEATRVFQLGMGDDPKAIQELAGIRVVLARRRWDVALPWFKNGQINIDRVINASKDVQVAERDAANTKDGVVAAARSHLDRMGWLVGWEQDRLDRKEGSELDASEARFAHAEAALVLLEARRGAKAGDRAEKPADADREVLDAVNRFRADDAGRRFDLLCLYYANGTLAFNRLIDASRVWRDADLAVSTTPASAQAALRSHLLRMHRQIEKLEKWKAVLHGRDFQVEKEAESEHALAALRLAEAKRAARIPVEVNPSGPK